MEKVQVGLGDRSYEIRIGSGLRSQAAQFASRHLVITDSNVNALWGEKMRPLIPQATWYEFPAGERNKTPETVIGICRTAAEERFDRHAMFVALGGGVVGDMTGFAAAVYMRGVRFIQMPTTLLAMVDSSVGGKTGVDIPEGKNLIGAFHQPELVVIDTDFLTTLPVAEIRCGLAEIVKTAVLFDETLFAELEISPETLTTAPNWSRFPALIRRSCAWKAQIVAADEKESGVRALLNYGHTFGHAVELLSDFGIGHGEGVSIGMCCAAVLAGRLALWSTADSDRQLRLLRALGLPTALPPQCTPEAMVAAMRRDKKNSGGAINLVLPRAIGRAELVKEVPESEIIAALEVMHD